MNNLNEHEIEADRLLYIYNKDGQHGVYDYVKREHPDWAWSLCEPCEDTTPTWGEVCAVCWTSKENIQHGENIE